MHNGSVVVVVSGVTPEWTIEFAASQGGDVLRLGGLLALGVYCFRPKQP